MNTSVKAAGIVLGFGGIGLMIAGILENFYDRGIFVTFVSYLGLSITEFMGLIIVFFLVLGIAVAAVTS